MLTHFVETRIILLDLRTTESRNEHGVLFTKCIKSLVPTSYYERLLRSSDFTIILLCYEALVLALLGLSLPDA